MPQICQKQDRTPAVAKKQEAVGGITRQVKGLVYSDLLSMAETEHELMIA